MASCAERGLSVLDREICGLQVEMRSEKLTMRHKAFSRMVAILSNQEDVFLEYMDSDSFNTEWGDIFDAVYQGILVQSGSSAASAKGKNNDYFVVLLKLVELAMDRDAPRLQYSQLIGASVRALKEPSVRSTFGVPFLQVLNKYVLSSKWDLTPVSYEEWKEILECSFEIMDENQIARQVAVACLSSSVRKFLDNCSLSSMLVEYLPNLINYVRQTEKGKVLHELMRVACHIVQDLAVDCRTEVIKFLDSFLPYTIKAYEAKMDAEQKSVLFRLMHLSLIILFPDGKQLSAAERLAKDVALSPGVDEAARKKSLRQYYYIVTCELKANHSTSYSAAGGARENKFTDGFIDFAARLCFTIYWNEGILEDSNSEGSASKKVKLSSKLQSLIDLVINDSNHHDWRWFVITSHVMDRHHGALQGEDYSTVLQLLCDIQPSLQMPEQQQAFYRCSRVVLEFEQTDTFRSLIGSVIDEAFCRERWTKITTTTFRGCTSTAAKESAESNALLQLLIKHRKYPNISFLSGTVLKAFYTHAIKKTNVNVATVQVILETLASVECLGSVDEVLDPLFNYLFPQTRESQAKEILHSKERLDAKLLAKISVLAVVAKHSSENDDEKKQEKLSKRAQKHGASFHEQEDRLKSLEQTLLWQNVDELVTMEDVDICQTIESKPSLEVTYNVNEALFEKLTKAINFEKHTLPDNSGMLAMALVNLCYDMELYLEILNVLLLHGAYDEAQCDKCLLAKKVQFKFQEIVLGLQRLLENVASLSSSELTEIGNRLLAIFRGPHHASVRKILQKLDVSTVLRWTKAQIDNTAGADSQFAEVINAENLSHEQRTKRCFLHIIAHYLQYDGVNSEEAYDLLNSIELNTYSNIDLFCVFDLCRILLRQPSHEFIADWVSRQFIDVCKQHHTNVAVTEVIITLYADLVMFVSPFEDMEKIVATILYSFTKKCANRTYSADLQAKIVAQIKFLLKAFPQYLESNLHQKVYSVLVPLLGNPSYRIKMEATRTLLHFLQPEWAYREEAKAPSNYYDFQSALYGNVQFDEVLETNSVDEKLNSISTYIQLLLGAFSVSYVMRRRALRDLIVLVYVANVSDEKIISLVRLVSESSGIDAKKVLQSDMDTVLELWLTRGYKLQNFPYRLVGNASSLEEFVHMQRKNLAFVMLCIHPEQFQKFCESIRVEPTAMMKAVVPKCVSFLLPHYAKCEGMPQKYTKMAENMHKAMASFLGSVDLNTHILGILKYITYRLHDSDELRLLLEQDVPRFGDEAVTVTKAIYVKALEHLKECISDSTGPMYSLPSCLCLKSSAQIERTLMEVKRWLWDTDERQQKMVHLFHYTVLFEDLQQYFMQQEETSFKSYLVRDVVYFLCNLLNTLPALRLATLNSLGRFLALLVTATDAGAMLSVHLNFIVSSLLETEVREQPTSKVAQKSLSLLRLLIVQHVDTFADAIAKLNYLPADERFAELREIIAWKKSAHGKTVSLAREIDGLTQLPNIRYEDLVALKILLCSKKDELQAICQKLSIQSVSNDESSVLNRLIYTLIELVRSSTFDKRTVEALRCLGEVGPIDLGTMLLKSEVETVAYDSVANLEDAIKKTAETTLMELNVLLTSKNVTVGRVASQIAYQLLHGKTFHSIGESLPTLRPFMGTSSAEVTLFSYGSVPKLTALLENEEKDFRMFVEELANALLCALNNTMLKALVGQEETFAVKLVPLLMQISLKLSKSSVDTEIGLFLNRFFEKFGANRTDSQKLFNNPKAVQLMLTIVECVRVHNQHFAQHQIKLDYLPIAEASKYCQAHFKAILYAELWYNAEITATNSKATTGPTKATAKRTLGGIMKFCHQAIGVYDAVKAFLDPILERTEYYSLQQNHTASLLFLDASFGFRPNDANVAESLAHASKKCSLYGVARSLNAPSKVDYECLWRLGDWSLAIDAERMDAGKSEGQSALTINSELFERAHYKALKCLELKDDLAVESAISDGRRAIVEMFKLTSTESTKHIYHGLCRLRQLQQIEDFADIQFFRKIDCEQDLLNQWDAQDKLPYSEFGLMERLLSQRLCIFNTARVRAKRKWVPQAIYNTLVLLIHESRLGGYHDSALRNIRIATEFELPPNVKALVQLEDAQLNWSLGDRKLACELALEVMENQRYNNLMVNATACRVYGEFMAESHTKEVYTLYQDYFQQSEQCVTQALASRKTATEAIAIDHRCFDSERNFTVLYTVAKYADRELGRLDKFLHSKDWELRQQNIVKMKAEIERLKQEGVGANEQRRKEISRQYTFTQKNMLRAQKATDTVKTERLNYLQLALANYILFAKEDTIKSDTVIFRILALWLSNQHIVQIQEILAESIDQIPSHKFIAVLPQLTARLSVTGSVGKLIDGILLRCGTDHPHHTLPFVFAQLYAFKDLPPNEVPENDGRLLGAKALYEKLKNIPSIEHIVGQMNRMNLALIDLANKSISKNPSFQEYTMTERDPLRRLTNLDRIHCPTIELPVNKSGSYKHLVKGVSKWDPKIVGVGGINVPKKLKCRCTDGVERTQLLKGKDDMRQDAVMQQVFGILNILLRNDKETANRNLSIKTYKVVPLSRQSGILEWCNDTVPIGVWLTQGHEKYRPEDYKPSVARKKYSNNAQPGMTVDKKLQNYLDICRKIKPVFRYYFLEHYLEPGKWFERRQNYTKSVATSSMIGHILGIGDRHVQNILIDKRTAEVIHIDFGIAFEMGKNLPTSETIPFRLTRDIVDGMGISGVEGVFKKSCEKTMEVLRNNQAPILTILEVLLYDPLYSWNVLANKKANQQQISEELTDSPIAGKEGLGYAELSINVTAEHALMQVKKKLDGKEDDKFMSVEGQVQKLIFSATSERNLCQLFHGWQPYL
ncbi:serine/threonine-protein kinase ATM [Anopheles ziemanni]|uniref:serine/threonine-protein kinase ATM n=1 Tax=Anopheles coustani TaxID=139045 RepID=UPI002659105C|nr:serine/threonine-protein kinase ATM [Anopheles coustani]XP_058177456.1 serine/threonine-protein kinase ATM [Anopheles ziemanni]